MDKARRNFFKDYFIRDTVKIIREAQQSFQEEKTRAEYFQSFETAYPLISETMLFMDDEVKELGINTSGKTNLEIVEDIYSKRNKNNKAH